MRPNWFVGIPVAAGAQLHAEIPAPIQADIRLFHPDDLHMTLAFLGPMAADKLGPVQDILSRIEFKAFDIELSRLVALPKPRRFSAISWELGQGREQAAALIGSWRAALIEAAQARPDLRPPRPHITVARPKRKATPMVRDEILKWLVSVPAPKEKLRIDRVALYTWADDRRQRQFKIVSERKMALDHS